MSRHPPSTDLPLASDAPGLRACPLCGCSDLESSPWPTSRERTEWVARCGNPECGCEARGSTAQECAEVWNHTLPPIRRYASDGLPLRTGVYVLFRDHAARVEALQRQGASLLADSALRDDAVPRPDLKSIGGLLADMRAKYAHARSVSWHPKWLEGEPMTADILERWIPQVEALQSLLTQLSSEQASSLPAQLASALPSNPLLNRMWFEFCESTRDVAAFKRIVAAGFAETRVKHQPAETGREKASDTQFDARSPDAAITEAVPATQWGDPEQMRFTRELVANAKTCGKEMLPLNCDFLLWLLDSQLTHESAPAPRGDWLWGKLMDWCRQRGVPPAHYDDLFAIVSEARAAQPSQK